MDLAIDPRDRIMGLLTANPVGLSITRISRAVGLSRNTVSKNMEVLLTAGRVELVRTGASKVFRPSQMVPINAMMDMSGSYIAVLDRGLRLLMVNDALLELLRTKKEMLLDLCADEYWIPILSDPLAVTSMRAALRDGASTFDLSFDGTGSLHHFSGRSVRTTLGDGEMGVTVMFEDVTEHRNSAERTRLSEEKYRAIFESSDDGIILSDGTHILERNGAIVRMFGRQDPPVLPADMDGLSPESQPDGRRSSEFMSMIAQCSRNGSSSRFEWTFMRDDGTSFISDVTLVPLTLQGRDLVQVMIRDISARRRSEAALALFSSAVKASVDSILLIGMDGRFIDVNDSFLKMIGIDSKEQVVGEDCFKYLNREFLFQGEAAMTQLMACGSVNKVIVRIDRADGSNFVCSSSATLIKDAKGEPNGIVVISRDITDRITILDDLRKRSAAMMVVGALVVLSSTSSKVTGAAFIGGRSAKDGPGNYPAWTIGRPFPGPIG